MTTKVREKAAEEIAAGLFEAEMALEEAAAKTATVMAAMLTARKPAGLSVLHCQEALEEATCLSELLIKARRQSGKLHQTLTATQRQVGLRHVAFGAVGKPLEAEERTELRPVA